MKAVILAAGKGTRMKHLTEDLPKPMVAVHDKPVLQWIIEGMRDHGGITDVFLIVGYKREVIEEHFGDGKAFGINVTYGVQEVQDGTGKAPEVAKDWVGDDRFLLTYGDILIEGSEYGYLVDQFTGEADGVLALKDGQDLSKGGAVVLNDEGWMIDLVEKPVNPPPNAYYNAGIYLLSPRIYEFTAKLEKSPRGEYELTDALTGLMSAGGKLRGAVLRQDWVDVRDPETLAELNAKSRA